VTTKFERGELVRMAGMKNELHIVLGPGATEHHWRVLSLVDSKCYTAPFYWMIRLKRDKQ